MNKRSRNAPARKAAAMTQEEMCVLAYLINRRILFRATEDIGHVPAEMIGHIYEGRVKVVHPRKRRIKVEFKYHWTRGTTKTLWMDFENIVATWDRNMGSARKSDDTPDPGMTGVPEYKRNLIMSIRTCKHFGGT